MTGKRRHARRGGLLVLVTLIVTFGGVRSAFSVTVLPEGDELEAGLALPAFASSGTDPNGLTFAQLERIRFVESEIDEDPDEKTEESPGIEDATSSGERGSDAAPVPEKRQAFVNVTVRRGESLGRIASRHGISVETLRSCNPGTTVKPGSVLRVPSRNGVGIRVEKGITAWDLARRYRVHLSDILSYNGITDPESLKQGALVFIPGARPLPAPVRSSDVRQGRGFMAWPVPGGRISSAYGYRRHPISGKILFHRGLDIAMYEGAPVKAVKDGVVIFSGRRGGYGYVVDIRHADGMVTRYAHNSALTVRAGARVTKGQVVAKVGSTGHSTGPHVHFEVIMGGRRTDPLRHLTRR